jgi:hypothetical protein
MHAEPTFKYVGDQPISFRARRCRPTPQARGSNPGAVAAKVPYEIIQIRSINTYDTVNQSVLLASPTDMSKIRKNVAMAVAPIETIGTVTKTNLSLRIRNFHLKGGVKMGVRPASFWSRAFHSLSVGRRPLSAYFRLLSDPRSIASKVSACSNAFSSNKNSLSLLSASSCAAKRLSEMSSTASGQTLGTRQAMSQKARRVVIF